MAWDRSERRSSDLVAALPEVYLGLGKRRSTAGAPVPQLFDPRTGFFTMPVLAEFIHYELDGYSQTLANERFVTPMCVAAIGIDALPDPSDQPGRERLLEVAGGEIHRVTRTADRLGRAGTDFIALLRRTLAKNVREFYAPRVASLVADASREVGLPTTISVGISSLTEHLIRNPDDMIAKALRALSAAREHGRGSVAVYDLRAMPLD